MHRQWLKWVRYVLLVLFLVFSVITLFIALAGCDRRPLPDRITDEFDPNLARITSINDAVAYLRKTRKFSSDYEFANAADNFIRKRFFYGNSFYTPCDNWVAYVAGYVWLDLRSPVIADDILKYRRAMCSQQAIAFQQIIKHAGISYASVRLPGHFVAAAKLDGEWHIFDSTIEIPVVSFPFESLRSGDETIIQYYQEFGPNFAQAARNGDVKLEHIDGDPAPKATLFHRFTHFFSNWGWAIFLLCFIASIDLSTAFRSRRDAQPT